MSDLFDLPFEEDEDDAQRGRGSQPEEAVRLQPDRGAGVQAERRILTVTELTILVRDHLEARFAQVWVEGELSNCRVWNTGHLYFTLKDGASQLKGVVFRSALRYLKFKPADGLRVVARGRVSVYEPKGEYQIVCEYLEPQGLGALQLAFDQLKKQLQAEGLFDAARKRSLPALPRRIGVVTSLDGAAIRDILRILARRHANAHVVIRPTRVQGEGAALDIARAIRAIARVADVDVIIAGRGGGSIEDLWAFNEEPVARAIAASPVPVISAVGHESDVTIADFVADVRAATPSAAAEIVVARTDEFVGRIDRLGERLRAAMRARHQALDRRLHVLVARPAFAAFPARLAMRGRLIAELAHGLRSAVRGCTGEGLRTLREFDRRLEGCHPGRHLATLGTRLVAAEGRLTHAAAASRHRAERQFRDAAARLEALSPLAVLARGYAVCWTADRRAVLRRAADVGPGDTVRVTLGEGELGCRVESTD